jgi:hypothetical protein
MEENILNPERRRDLKEEEGSGEEENASRISMGVEKRVLRP